MSATLKTELPAWIREKNGEISLAVRATPRASRSEICNAEDEWLKVRLKAAPVDGKANKELISFFAKLLKLPKKKISGYVRGRIRDSNVLLSKEPESKIYLNN